MLFGIPNRNELHRQTDYTTDERKQFCLSFKIFTNKIELSASFHNRNREIINNLEISTRQKTTPFKMLNKTSGQQMWFFNTKF